MAARTCLAGAAACALSLPHLHNALGQRWLMRGNFDIRQNALATLDALSALHANVRITGQYQVAARAELDEANALSPLKNIALFRPEDDAAGQQSGDQLEGDEATVALHCHHALLIALGGCGIHRVQIFAFFVLNAANGPTDGRTIDVDVEDIQEDAEANP